MTINQMAWVASGIGFLAIAGSASLEATPFAGESTQTMSERHTTTELDIPKTADLIAHGIETNLDHNVAPPYVAKAVMSAPFDDRHHSPALATPVSTFQQPAEASRASRFAYRIQSPQTQKFWRCPTSLLQHTSRKLFPIKMHGCVVAYSDTDKKAQHISQRLNQQLQNPATDWNQLLPDLTGEHASIKLDEQFVLSVPAVATAESLHHPHQIVARWANNIRQVAGRKPLPLADAQRHMYEVKKTAHAVRGYASWYGPYFHGRLTANGEIYDQHALTAAHRDLPLGSFVQVTNRNNGRSIVVRINDRGPYLDESNRIIDLSYRAAQILDSEHKGIVPIDMVVLRKAPAADPAISTAMQTVALQP